MSEQQGQQEPSMEEILASIRKIISEDGEDDAARPEPEDDEEEELELDDAAEMDDDSDEEAELELVEEEQEDEEDALDLTDAFTPAAEPESEMDEIEVVEEEMAPPPPPPPPPRPVVRSTTRPDERHVVSQGTALAGTSSFAQLASAIESRRGGITVEQLVEELVRPMLREWLDQNLPSMVERLVQREIQRMAERADSNNR